MYTGKQYFIGFALILSTVLSSWLVLQSPPKEIAPAASANHADTVLTDIIATRMNETTGKPQDQLRAPIATHYPLGNMTELVQPHVTIFQATGEPWHLTANHGQAHNGLELVKLWDNVVLQQAASAQTKPITIKTSAVTIHPKQQYAETDQFVTAEQPGTMISAVGMHADLKTGNINLLSKVHGTNQQ